MYIFLTRGVYSGARARAVLIQVCVFVCLCSVDDEGYVNSILELWQRISLLQLFFFFFCFADERDYSFFMQTHTRYYNNELAVDVNWCSLISKDRINIIIVICSFCKLPLA